MLPVVAIVGKPNVGKSTLFNRLINKRSALVVDLPGTTIDRNYGCVANSYFIIDTAGINNKIDLQTKKAIVESQLILFVVDAHTGLLSIDHEIINKLRKFNKTIFLIINKIDGINLDFIINDFYSLGIEQTIFISALANKGINKITSNINLYLKNNIINNLHKNNNLDNNKFKLAIVGQPNVGKSTLMNYLLKEDRVVVENTPGTTRDSIYVNAKIGKHNCILIDTAGVRRKAKVKETLEKFSVIKTLQAIEDATVVILLIDATKGIVEQDLKLINNIIDLGRSLVIAINKLDQINLKIKNKLQTELKRELSFIDYIKPVYVSAVNGHGVNQMLKLVIETYNSTIKTVGTNKLSLLLQLAVRKHQPPITGNGRRIKLRYAHIGGHLPFKIIIHGNQVAAVPNSYKKYLSNFFQQQLKLVGTMVHIEFKQSSNPYG